MPLTDFVRRYRPYVSVVAILVLLVWFVPGDPPASHSASEIVDIGGPGSRSASGVTDPNAPEGVEGASGTLGPDGTDPRTPDTQPGAPRGGGNPLDNPACDPKTGRVRMPSRNAPPCVAAYSGDNGGTTSSGVTKDAIRLVYFQPESDPAVEAALTAAGASNTPAEQRATFQGYVDILNVHAETYGRKVQVIFRSGSGAADDDAIGRADALAIATEDKPFAVIGAPNATFVETLAAKKIICICLSSLPQDHYERLDPYFGYTPLMGSTQGYIHRAEYVGKRLAGRNAVHAGQRDATPMSLEKRKFGILYYDTPDGSYKSGVDYFVKELRAKYGVQMTEVLAYPSDLAESTERARPLIQRLKDSGVTTVLFSGDFINPATYTRQATLQGYFPEWIITGSLLTDTTLFARTYDQAQWANAFGLSFLVARSPDEFNDAFRLWRWHFGNADIPADNQFKTIYPGPSTFFTGVHLAGPNLTPASWQRGLFAATPSGSGLKTVGSVSFGRHGLWPFTDYTALDDVTEIWWDPGASGEDEVGNQGVGMYRYVDGGRRFLPGQHPRTDPVVFTAPQSAPTFYNRPPPGEEPPDYPHSAHR